jgi:hypothetical protein
MGATPTFTGFWSDLEIRYETCGWTFAAVMGFDETGWSSSRFDASVFFGVLRGYSTIEFHPQTAAFSFWEGSLRVMLSGVYAEAGLRLEDIGTGWWVGLFTEGAACTATATAHFNLTESGEVQTPGCTACFSGAWVDIAVSLGCLEPLRASLGFTGLSFDGFTIALEDLALPGIPWLLFDISFSYDDGILGKQLTVFPHLRLGDGLCFTLYSELLGTDTLIEGIELYGLEVMASWRNVYVSSLSAFDTSDPYDLILDPFWEVLRVGSLKDVCCDGDLTFEVSTYFDDASVLLFDWGMTDVDVSVGIGRNVIVSLGLTISAAGIDEICFGAGLIW